MITNTVGLSPFQDDVLIPGHLFLGDPYKIAEPISLTTIMSSETRPDLLASITEVLKFTKSSPGAELNPGSIARLVFMVETDEGRTRVVYYSDINTDGTLSPLVGDDPYCVTNIERHLYCRIVEAYHKLIGQ